MPQPSRRAHRHPPRNAVAIAARVAAYFLLAWGTLATLAVGLFPGALALTVAVAAYTMAPLVAFIRWRGWPFYPGRAFRLLVVRPFWYTQLLLPLVSAAGLLGLLLGTPLGHGITAGRTLASTVLTVSAAILLSGYLGARRLTVRNVDVEVPGLGTEFDGLRIVQLSDLHVGPHT